MSESEFVGKALANAIIYISELERRNAELIDALKKISEFSPYSNDVMDAIAAAETALAKDKK